MVTIRNPEKQVLIKILDARKIQPMRSGVLESSEQSGEGGASQAVKNAREQQNPIVLPKTDVMLNSEAI